MRATQKHVSHIIRLAESVHHTQPRDVLADFAECWASAFLAAVELGKREELLARYQTLQGKYGERHQGLFKAMLDELEQALTIEPSDVMGQVFMQIGSPNQARGQVFTPDSLCEVMARVQIGDGEEIRKLVDEKGFFTVQEPACGSGATVIAVAKQLQQAGINYQQHMHATAVDIDIRAVHLAYMQLTLLHIPAKVLHGNTLTMNFWSQWATPAHVMGLFDIKLRRGYALDSARGRREVGEPVAIEQEAPVPAPAALLPQHAAGSQLGLAF